MPRIKRIHSSWFSFNKHTGTFSAEASTLQANGVAPEGDKFVLVSQWTGGEKEFYLHGTHHDEREGELLFWRWKPQTGGDMQVLIYND